MGLAALLWQRGDGIWALRLLALIEAHAAALAETRLLTAQLRAEIYAAPYVAALAGAEAMAQSEPIEVQIASALRFACG